MAEFCTSDPPLTVWYCDTCGERIALEDGEVVWRCGESADERLDFRIVHREGTQPAGRQTCDRDRSEYTGNLTIRKLTGPEGASYLVGFLAGGPPDEPREDARQNPLDLYKFVDLFRRLQMPYYEQARRRFFDEAVRNHFGTSTDAIPVNTDCLRNIAENNFGRE